MPHARHGGGVRAWTRDERRHRADGGTLTRAPRPPFFALRLHKLWCAARQLRALSSSMYGGYAAPVRARATGKVWVCVRVRPLQPSEEARHELSAARTGIAPGVLQIVTSKAGDRETLKQFEFDRVCGQEVGQETFFESCGIKRLVDNALQGINASVLAYGQTGSGKTYTMSGHEEHLSSHTFSVSDASAGLILRAVDYLFSSIAAAPPDVRTIVRASYCEIYNEMVYDLLNMTGESLPLRWAAGQGFFVQGQLIVQCDDIRDVCAVLAEGHKNRTVGSHELNFDSSRSHSIMQLLIERVQGDPISGERVTRRSKLLFIDLAGSERLKETKSVGLTALESRQINKSLFALGNVIAALSAEKRTAGAGAGVVRGRGGGGSGGDAETHIPYRDSKLTKLLQDSLGGTALTLMIACVSPASAYVEETLNTLAYAKRAGKIENSPVIQIDTKDALILSLKHENRALREELDALRTFFGIPADMPTHEAVLYMHRRETEGVPRFEGIEQPAAYSALGFTPRLEGMEGGALPAAGMPTPLPPPHRDEFAPATLAVPMSPASVRASSGGGSASGGLRGPPSRFSAGMAAPTSSPLLGVYGPTSPPPARHGRPLLQPGGAAGPSTPPPASASSSARAGSMEGDTKIDATTIAATPHADAAGGGHFARVLHYSTTAHVESAGASSSGLHIHAPDGSAPSMDAPAPPPSAARRAGGSMSGATGSELQLAAAAAVSPPTPSSSALTSAFGANTVAPGGGYSSVSGGYAARSAASRAKAAGTPTSRPLASAGRASMTNAS